MNCKISKYITDSTGKKHEVHLVLDKGLIYFSGRGKLPELIPVDRQSYKYTHGGELYQLACDLFWKLKR